MVVRRYPLVKLESIVRGYITGSAWSEYQKKGTVHGLPMPAGLKESQKLEKPLWTPSTKAEQGEHDENISSGEAGEIVGVEVARRVEEISLKVYQLVSLPAFTLLACLHCYSQSLTEGVLGARLRRETRHSHRRHQVRVRH